MAYPLPWGHGLADKHLALMWRNYLVTRLSASIYTNANSVWSWRGRPPLPDRARLERS